VQSRLEHKLDSKLFDVADKMEMKVDDLKASAKLGAGEVKQAAARLTRWPLDRSSCTRSLTTGAGGDGGIDRHQELTEISLCFYSFAIPFLLAASPRRPPAGRPAGCTPRSSLSTGAMGVLRRVREGGVKVMCTSCAWCLVLARPGCHALDLVTAAASPPGDRCGMRWRRHTRSRPSRWPRPRPAASET
jgi:hypothetical protein